MMYKCRCPANYTSCSSTSPAENATTCVDNERGTVYSACTGENTCTEDEESIYKTCTKQQVGMGRSCTSSDGTTKYAECQDTKDCKANGYKYVCSGYQADALGEDFCIDENGSKLFKECKCPANYLQCPAKNVKGTPCTPLLATGESGETVYSKCECGSQYSETCDGNGQSPGSEDDACQTTNTDGDTVTYYKSCVCGDEYSKTCAETGAIPTDKSEVCTEIKYVGNQKVQTQKYKSCGCGEAYKYKCDGTDDGDDANNAAKYTLSNGCTTTVDGESVTRYKACLCGSSYTVTCTSNIQPGADSCTSINADGSKSTKYVAGSCPEPEPEPCVPADCSSYSIASLSAIVGQCGHPKTTALAVPDATSRQNMPVCIPKLTLKVPGNIPAKIVRNPMNSAMAKPLNLPEARLKPVIRFAVVPQLITKPTQPAKISILLRLQAPPGTLSVLNVPNRYPEAIRHLRRHPADQFWGWTKVMSA